MKKILVGGAWPYANGSLHIGHIAGLLPGDVIARYHRAAGNDVYYVSGSDCHGTPVSIRAKKEGVTPQEISNRYHKEFCECFSKLGFSYDQYGKTSQQEHVDFVREFHKKLYESEYVYEKTIPQAYCETCHQFLPDRFVEGICPKCGEKARGDQCDHCGTVLEPEQLLQAKCSICGNEPKYRETSHLYIAIHKLEKELKKFLEDSKGWRKNAIAFTKRYIDEGLRDRALTRDLDWGIPVPKRDFEDKKIYIWAENVLGYLSMSSIVAKERGVDFQELWGENAYHYYVHAKDNIPFHTIILPSLLLAEGEGYHLPDKIVSNEYLTLEGRKISTSENWAIWMKDVVDVYDADSLRYYLLAHGPEKRDMDFTELEYKKCHNGELLGGYGNFINRTLVFVEKYQDGILPAGSIDREIRKKIEKAYRDVGNHIEAGRIKDAIHLIFDLVRYANKYYDEQEPWNTRTTNVEQCNNTIYNCVQLCGNLAVLLSPFLPFSSDKVKKWLGFNLVWEPQWIQEGKRIEGIEVLFQRI